MTNDEKMYICPDADEMKCTPADCAHAVLHEWYATCMPRCHVRDEAGLESHTCCNCEND